MTNNSFLRAHHGIYAICHIDSNKMYIGSTTRTFYDRWCSHKSALNKGKHSSIYLQRAWNKYGSEAFFLMVLETNTNPKDIISREIQWINLYKSYNKNNGYNMAKEVSPNRLGHTQSKAARNAISTAMKGIKKTSEHAKNISTSKKSHLNPNYGKKESLAHAKERTKNSRKRISCSYLTRRGSMVLVFESLFEAAKTLDCSYQGISQALRKGYKCKGFTFKYL